MHPNTGNTFDVAILGAGLSGAILGAILARKGVRVVMIDAGAHPRFAIGESTIPHTSLLLSALAERHDVPEIDYLAYPDRIAEHVCTTCGIKRAFGFAYHRPGRDYDPSEGLIFGTSSKDENHLFRQDVDAYLFHTAVRYGVTPRLHTRVASVAIDRDGATLTLEGGGSVRAQYVVDGTGFRSVLARQFGLRETPPGLRHHSRCLFTHMIDVAPFEDGRNPLSLPWEQCTLHHVFEGGWFWVIPFNNYERSRNPLVSVGLTLDPRVHPKPEGPPEAEFKAFLDRFPAVARQFREARAVRPWVATGRLQYTSRRCTGYRYGLTAHAAGFVDPLYSRGLINTLEMLQALLDPLLGALDTGDFSEDAFLPLETLHRRVLDYNDRLVRGSYAAWKDFDLWNAWVRVWALGTILTEYRLMNALSDYSATGDRTLLDDGVPDPIFSPHEDPDYRAFFERAEPILDAADGGALPPGEAASRLFALTGAYSFPVPLRRDAMRRAGWLAGDEVISDRNLRFAREGYRWALTNPTSRDLFGNTETFFRWRARHADPHLAS